ncbi:polysaccharide ABC transporter ATP-binding protein [Pedobacter sp. MR22-3]|uniref:ABC transporter ATP-binding protein n=1 Tax=Pedobacter sp. MR22-3 TaxID=2994552 RepID=UPI0022456A63|nr:polysaccharide ABC transporter ATP-binding protein [Pedobacter sp. MR22-3]MCX2585045.1 polysaccharide ABC transporter ATP-binding protein [Pedobacter sp. MR22-3]
MLSHIAIKVENLSKAYQLGQIGTGTISRDLERWYARMRGKEDPFLRIGESNNQHTKSESDVVWSLKDINFEIEKGDAVGIIGRNGAGKSTLLKILSKVTAPTTGKISGKGRIASLLEVGTGFHPELSGRENIFLNGAILGMRKREIQRKLDEIVDFAGIERYLDTPVKRYSSGMYVRLAFAVAAHLESEILIVDEVLAVGDAEFQKKCLGKMGEVSKGEGRTVLFVSHNINSIRQLCNKGILLENGLIVTNSGIETVIAKYQEEANQSNSYFYNRNNEVKDKYVKLLKLFFIDAKGAPLTNFDVCEDFGAYIEYEISDSSYKPDLSFLISTEDRIEVFHIVKETNDYTVGIKKWSVWFPKDLFNNMKYIFTLGITSSNPIHIHLQTEVMFEVNENYNSPTRDNSYRGKMHGVVRPNLTWTQII